MTFIDSLLNYLTLASPYLLLGLLVGGFIHEFMPHDKIKKWLGGNKLSHIVKAALVGVPLPLCSCSVIPTAVSLQKSGASKEATSSFLIATPESGVDSISVTYALMDLPMTIIRPLAAFVSAITAGLMQRFFNTDPQDQLISDEPKSCCKKNSSKQEKKINGENDKTKTRAISAIRFGFGDLINDIALWLLIGMLAGALIDYAVPPQFFETLSPSTSKFFIILIGVPLYICASATTPIAVALILKGMSPGTALILLLVGPATNVSNIAVLKNYLGTKGMAINIISIVVIALLFGFLTDYLYEHYITLDFAHSHDHSHEDNSLFSRLTSVVLTILIFKGIWLENIKPRFISNKNNHHNHH